MLTEIVAQTDKAARLLERAQRAAQNVRGLRSGDRVYTPLPASAEFSQGAAPSANLIFNVPADADFWAYRLLLYPLCKVVDPVNGTPSETTFRETTWSSVYGDPGFVPNPATLYTDINTLADATFALIYEGKEYQNIDTPVSAAYCVDMLKWVGASRWGGASQTPSGMVFDVPLFLARSKSLVCRVTPTFLGIRTIEEPALIDDVEVDIVRQHRYKIVGILEGEKKVAALR